MTDEEILAMLEVQDAEREQRFRQMMIDEGHLDHLADYDRRMREIRLGLTAARNCWHSISPAQRTALEFAQRHGGGLRRVSIRPSEYYTVHGVIPQKPIRLATVRNLAAHELLAWDGGATDPERVARLTERGRFVLLHGRPS